MTKTYRSFDGFDVIDHGDGRIVYAPGQHAGTPDIDEYCRDMTRVATKFRLSHWNYRND